MRRIIDHEMEVSETVGTGKRPTPSAAIRAYCRLCLGLQQWRRAEVEDCQGGQSDVGPCPLFLHRLGKRPSVKVFRAMCLQCTGGARGAVTECAMEDCPCHPFRFGRNSALTGKRGLPPERMAAIRAVRCP